jgi:hypothetical protein
VFPSAEKLRVIVEALDGDPDPLVRLRDELALRRIGVDAETVLQIREEFGELTEAERAAIKEALRRVREGETA